jgi:hypothetical protein
MYDSTNPFAIPTTAAMIAGYIDGIYAWPVEGWQRFAGKPAWKIAVFYGTNNGNVLDVEQYDATPAQAPIWVKKRLAAGMPAPAILYVNRGNRGAVEAALRAAGVTAQQAALWVATLDGTQAVPAGTYPVVAVQYANATMAGGHYDLSIVTAAFGAATGHTGEDDLLPDERSKLFEIWELLQNGALKPPVTSTDNPSNLWWLSQALNNITAAIGDLKAEVAAIPAAAPAADLTATNAKIDALAGLVLKIETGLKSV